MRKFINIVENPNVITVYHGDQKPNVALHRGMFFSTDRDFCTNYGPHITEYRLHMSRFADSTDLDLIEEFLPLYDSYHDSEVETVEDYEQASNGFADTWEIVEPVAEAMVNRVGLAGIIVYEGGIRNFMVYDTSVVTPIV